MTEKLLEVKDKFTPRDYQEPIIEAIIEHCKKSSDPAFVDISVGGGKTSIYAFVAEHVASKGGKVMVLARQGELVEQNSAFAWKAHVDNSVYSASLNKKSKHYPVIYGTEGTIARAIGENEPFGYTVDKKTGAINFNWKPDLLLIDECHQVNFDDEDNQYMKLINFFRTANPKMRIIGGTGSPIRGKKYIVGSFWKERLYELSTAKLVEWGWLVPPIFGFPESDNSYDFSSIQVDKDGDSFSDAELDKIVLEDPTKTHEIMYEIIDRTKDRLGVLIFCSTKKHCAEAAQALPEGSYGIVSDSTTYKERSKIYKDSRSGKIKYLINVGVLATGYNNPRIDTVCYLRPLDSLTLLIQTLGRGFRIPEEEDYFEKVNCLVLDYGDVFSRLGELYENPILEKAVAEKGKRKGEVLICPECTTENSMMARRCIGQVELDNDFNMELSSLNIERQMKGEDLLEPETDRCEFFWSHRMCPVCETKNDPCARECRNCKHQLIDPNEKLNRQHYTEKDLIDVISHKIIPCKNGTIMMIYNLANGEEAKEFFTPKGKDRVTRILWRDNFMKQHIDPKDKLLFQNIVNRPQDTPQLHAKAMCDSGLIKIPEVITHRINERKKSIINRKIFKERQINEQ